MKRAYLFVACLLATAIVLPVHTGAQTAPLPSVDEVINKTIAALGGRAALEKVTTIQAKGTISIPDMNLSGSIEVYQKAPDRALTIVSLAGTEQREGYDGTTAWTSDPQGGLVEKAGADLSEAKRAAVMFPELQMKTLYPTIKVSGREKVGPRDAYVVDATPAEGSPVRIYVDVESGLVVRQQMVRNTPMGPLAVDVLLEDYRAIDGVKHPFIIRQSTQMFSAVVQMSELRHNAPIDDGVFRRPK